MSSYPARRPTPRRADSAGVDVSADNSYHRDGHTYEYCSAVAASVRAPTAGGASRLTRSRSTRPRPPPRTGSRRTTSSRAGGVFALLLAG